MKKLLKFSAITVVLLMIAIIVLPMFYKDRIVALAKNEANKNLNATLDFSEIGLNFFSNFPDFTLTVQNLCIINEGPFAGDTLISMPSFEVTLDFMSLIRGHTVKVEALTLDNPIVALRVLQDGSANWEIGKATAGPRVSDTEGPESQLKLSLRRYEFNGARIKYMDQAAGLVVAANDLSHFGRGDFTQDHFQLQTETDVGSLSLTFGGIDYLNKTQMKLQANIDVNTLDSKFTLEENKLSLNNLLLTFEGAVEAPGEDLSLELDFEAPNTALNNILSLVPAVFQKDFADLNSSGNVGLQGFVKGKYGDNHFPAFDLKLKVADGQIQYRTLPTAVSNVDLDLQVRCPGGDLDRTIINLSKLRLEVGKDPFDAKLRVQTPISDPHISASVEGRVNLSEIRNILPMEKSIEIAGLIDAKLQFEGTFSSIEKRDYGKLIALGDVTVENVSYHGPDLPQRISMPQARLTFSPERVMLRDFVSQIGASDLRADGTLEQVLGFILSDQPLRGTLSTQAAFFDLNPFLEGPGGELTAFELPANVEFTLNSSFREVQYGKMKLQDVQGILLLKDRTLRVIDLKMNALDGAVVINGNYSTQENSSPQLFFDLRVDLVSIPKTFEQFVSVQKFVPVAKSMHGTYGARLEIVSELDQNLMPVWNTFNSRGSLSILQASLRDFKPLTMMAETAKIDALQSLDLKEVNAVYKIKDGRFYLSPVKFSKGDIGFLVSGSNGIDQSLDYRLQLELPAGSVNQRTNAALTQLLKRKIDLLTDESMLLNVSLGGKVDEPRVDFGIQDIVKSATAGATSALVQEFQEKKVALEDSVRAAIDKQKQDLDRLKKEAEEKAKREKARLKKEAEKKLKKLIKSRP